MTRRYSSLVAEHRLKTSGIQLLIVADGSLEVYGPNGYRKSLDIGDCVLTPTDVPVGMRTDTGAVYTEIEIRRKDIMNEAIKAGEIFKLAEHVPYAEGKIVNMDVVHNDRMKFVIMAFDEGTGLYVNVTPNISEMWKAERSALHGRWR